MNEWMAEILNPDQQYLLDRKNSCELRFNLHFSIPVIPFQPAYRRIISKSQIEINQKIQQWQTAANLFFCFWKRNQEKNAADE